MSALLTFSIGWLAFWVLLILAASALANSNKRG